MDSLVQMLYAHSYYLNPFSIAPILVATLCIFLGVFIQQLASDSKFNRSILFWGVSASIWLYANGFLLSTQEQSVAMFWGYVLHAGFLLTAASLFHISVVITRNYSLQKNFIVLFYVAAGLLSLSTLSPSMVEGFKLLGATTHAPVGLYPRAGLLYPALLVFPVVCLGMSLKNFCVFYRKNTEPLDRKKVRFFAMAFVLMSYSYVDLMGSFERDTYPVGFITICGFMVSVTCLTIRFHQKMIEERSEKLQGELVEKALAISEVVQELKTTQVKLLETGKISALASLSAGILHQISQPITAIHGFVRFIKKEMKEDNPFYRPICLMEEQSVYLKEMLEDLMELIRHRKIKKENVDVNAVIKRSMNLLTDELRIRRVNWDLELSEALPVVYADGVHLQQVFMNIVINALQAMNSLPRGSRKYIKIASTWDKENNKIVISFSDTGPGLTLEDRDQIFEPFFSTKTKGSGIGLALCKDLIAEHKGTIEVHNAQAGEGGAVFVIRLPCADASVAAQAGVGKV